MKKPPLDIFGAYATDEALETNGVWRDLNNQGARILVGRMGSEAFDTALREAVEKESASLSLGGDISDAAYKEIVLDVMAKTVLLGWENLAYQGGEVAPYSIETARKFLAHRDFRKVVERMANDIDRYRLKLEEEQGNG
jgi:hypothetical protein